MSISTIDDVLFTNAVLCLPKQQDGKFPVVAQHRDQCTPWLQRLIDDAQPTIIVSMGVTALDAIGRIERYGLALASAAGVLHAWYGRKLLPLYHAGRLGRIRRPEAAQRKDMRALRTHLGR